MSPAARHTLVRASWLMAASAGVLGVFALYTQPAFMVILIDQLWACF